ncbi:DUF3471 domain-containing protein [Roseivirga misakiensis]|uniref:Peptidase S12 Pab87-related C-terminal domain-containing protein n=1 Tax=Roseivirga misakiensis TaxID=1563681 RepID=A0A1E5SL41_9BACT|nr:DUF3471 domain-containing protein [Roseivirga misakiensis]OEJ99847.1 hypothetical protein BFP71_09870 [Roseivirga misakiensis]
MKTNQKQQTIRVSLFTLIAIALFQFGGQAQSKQEQGITVPKKTMKAYVGSYEMQKDTFLKIEIEKNNLQAVGPDEKVYELVPITNSRFFLKAFGVDIEFVKNDKDKITKLLMIREDGQQLEAIRVDED